MAEPIVPKSFGPPLGMYSHGMVAGSLVIVAGQVGLNAEGRVPGDDVVSQTKQALENVRTVVEAVRTAVADELGRLAGHRMHTLAVTVTGMRGPSAPAPARLR